jgi:glyceraldehyde-3-phosphate dehydrogenase (ferredoxin)
VEFLAPEILGRRNVERMTYELFSENSGICRFHRKWSETITDEILRAHYEGLDADYKAHQFHLAREIYDREAPKIVFWESERVIDMMMGYLVQWESDGLQTPELMDWLARFRADKRVAAKDYWRAIYHGIHSAFKEGPEAIPESFTPHQQKKQS